MLVVPFFVFCLEVVECLSASFLTGSAGTLVRRHRIPKPSPIDDQFFTVQDLNVGANVTLYGRYFSIFSCDPFTRGFLVKMGVRVPDDSTAPVDSFVKVLIADSNIILCF